MKKVLVTGANGQLGQTIKKLARAFTDAELICLSSEELDITSQDEVDRYFSNHELTHCINCAAYTNVDKAEEHSSEAMNVNANGVSNLATACKDNAVVLIHISTDYVFDGKKRAPYTEEDTPNPLNLYGRSKLAGEETVRTTLKEHFIIRTSWLYSQYGKNFLKTMLRLSEEKESIQVVNDQVGSPTSAADLVTALSILLNADSKDFGTYHISSSGDTSWHEFAQEILKLKDRHMTVIGVSSEQYASIAERSKYAVLDCSKFEKKFKHILPFWKDGLKRIMTNL